MLTRREMYKWLAKTVGPRRIVHCFPFPIGEALDEIVCEVDRMLACKTKTGCVHCGLDARHPHGKTLAKVRDSKNARAAIEKYERWLDQFQTAEVATARLSS